MKSLLTVFVIAATTTAVAAPISFTDESGSASVQEAFHSRFAENTHAGSPMGPRPRLNQTMVANATGAASSSARADTGFPAKKLDLPSHGLPATSAVITENFSGILVASGGLVELAFHLDRPRPARGKKTRENLAPATFLSDPEGLLEAIEDGVEVTSGGIDLLDFTLMSNPNLEFAVPSPPVTRTSVSTQLSLDTIPISVPGSAPMLVGGLITLALAGRRMRESGQGARIRAPQYSAG